MLDGMLEEKNIVIKDHVESWQDAIRLGCQILIDGGYVTAEYPEAILQATAKYGPYYVLAPQIAMPHASFENGVITKQISLLILKDPISFSPTSYDVRLLFTLATTDKESHLSALMSLAGIFQDEGLIEKLLQARTSHEAFRILNSRGKEKEED